MASNASNSPKIISLSGTGVTKVAHSVSSTWTASTSVVKGYNVYSSTVSGGNYVRLNMAAVASTNYTDNAVQAGRTYYYVVTAVGSNNVESSHTNEVSARVP